MGARTRGPCEREAAQESQTVHFLTRQSDIVDVGPAKLLVIRSLKFSQLRALLDADLRSLRSIIGWTANLTVTRATKCVHHFKVLKQEPNRLLSENSLSSIRLDPWPGTDTAKHIFFVAFHMVRALPWTSRCPLSTRTEKTLLQCREGS